MRNTLNRAPISFTTSVDVFYVFIYLYIVWFFHADLLNAPARFAVPSIIKIPEFWQYVLAIALGLPTCITIIDLSKEQSVEVGERVKITAKDRWIGVLTGGGLSLGLLFAVSFIRNSIQDRLATNTELKQLFLNSISFLGKRGTYGYIDPQSGELAAGHLAAIAFLLVGGAVYIAVGLGFKPKTRSNRAEVPTLLYLLLIISMLTLFYGGATFYFDYLRIPVLVLFLAFSAFNYIAFNVNHFFQLHRLENDEPDKKKVGGDSNNFKQVLEKRLQHQLGEADSRDCLC